MSRETIRPAPDDARASDVFSQRLRQRVLVEREIGDQALQPIVFVLELPQAAELAHAQVRVLLLPGIEGGLTDPQLPADVPDRGTALGPAQGVGPRSSENFERFIGPVLSGWTVEGASLL